MRKAKRSAPLAFLLHGMDEKTDAEKICHIKYFSYLCVLIVDMARFFRRYESTIYGNYRRAYAIGGVVTGALMAAATWLYGVLRGEWLTEPYNYVGEIALTVGMAVTAYLYRKRLPDGKLTLKELMLLGLGTGLLSAVVYGLWIWLFCGALDCDMVNVYNQHRVAQIPEGDDAEKYLQAVDTTLRYTAGDWAFISGFRTLVFSILPNFFIALLLRTEKAPVRERKR